MREIINWFVNHFRHQALWVLRLVRWIVDIVAFELRGVIDWFVNRFAAKNNFRCGTLWALTVTLLVFNLTIFGFGSAINFGGHSEEAQRYYNLYLHHRFATDAEIMPDYQRFLGGISMFFGWWWAWLRFSMWLSWFFLLVASIVYVPVAFQDELQRAYESIEALREERGGAAHEQQAPAPAPAGGEQFTFGKFLRWDIAVEFMTEIARTLLRSITRR